jgi:hypothetical protein
MWALRVDSNLSRNETVVCPEAIQLAGIDTASAGQLAPVRGIAVCGVWFDKSQRYPSEFSKSQKSQLEIFEMAHLLRLPPLA